VHCHCATVYQSTLWTDIGNSITNRTCNWFTRSERGVGDSPYLSLSWAAEEIDKDKCYVEEG